VAFPAYEWIHRQPDDSPCGWPSRGRKVSLRRPSQHESSRARIVVYGSLDSAENLGNQLPLIDQDRLVKSAKRGVRVGPYDGSLRGDIQAQDGAAVAAGRGRLAARAGSDDEDGGVSGHDLAEL
jgi:hypothetical protein